MFQEKKSRAAKIDERHDFSLWLFGEADLAERGGQVVQVGRVGRVTLHRLLVLFDRLTWPPDQKIKRTVEYVGGCGRWCW
jgi:hypothetical protein